MTATITNKEELICPFCGEGGFDAIGLKSHLTHNDCDEYKNTPVAAPRLSDLLIGKSE